MRAVRVPERLAVSVRALGAVGRRWVEDLPDLLAGLEADWSVTIGRALDGGSAAYVVEAVSAEGRPLVVKVALPAGVEGFTPFDQEVAALQLAGGDPYVDLVACDMPRRGLLLQRLGAPLSGRGWSRMRVVDILAETVARGWRPVTSDRLPTGADKARWLATFITARWRELGRPCCEATMRRAVDHAAERAAAFDPDTAVLVHGDAHTANLLGVPGAGGAEPAFRLIDPEGLSSEPAHDLGVILREVHGDLAPRDAAEAAAADCRRVGQATGVDPEAIGQWAFIERVSTGLFLWRLGHRDEAARYLAVADEQTTAVGRGQW